MRKKIKFPPVESSNEEGLVAVGGDLEVDTLLEAYKNGIFPWPINSYPQVKMPNTWFSPNPRGVLDFEEMHIPKSFLKFLKKTPFHITFNKAFDEVIQNCAEIPRKDKAGTWINQDIIDAYKNMFKQGYAYSVEVWKKDSLVAGIYGVVIGQFVSGESMFTYEDNASKQALYTLVHHLQDKNIKWLDTQMVTEVVKQFGGKYISRAQFKSRLENLNWTVKISDIF